MNKRYAPARSATIAACLGLALLAAGCSDKMVEECGKTAGDAQIAACTRLIDSGRVQGAKLAWGYTQRGNARGLRGNLAGAVEDLSRAVALDPNNARLLAQRGSALLSVDSLNAALLDLDRAIELEPSLAVAYTLRGLALAKRNELDGALANFTRSLELDGNQGRAYVGRGFVKRAKGDFDGALADYNRGLELEKSGSAYAGRGAVKFNKGDLDGALADYDESIALEANVGPAYTTRGEVYWMKGQLNQAANDLIRAQGFAPDPYAAIWLHLTRLRSGAENPQELASCAAKLDHALWPAPVIALYQGQATPEALLAAAGKADARTARDQTCEANFYLGEWYLLKGDAERAVPLLRTAAEQCPAEFVERSAAVAELARAGGGK